ncbi:sugar phosphate isomerase/epimerase family protein [Brevibacillus fulvus]|uniref:Sugar phosphate isomerase/epimerase n=1 Tax=Brevibacillus fulvus TaxID=1125967 RepID=A0A938XXE2_9BACL|nr:sugar phosphate isomerase/epimerase [Brevibacillus fulvus]MBM7589646.1 sugar phosphate isomerase/epimerase [Brevibacillus fulvus]
MKVTKAGKQSFRLSCQLIGWGTNWQQGLAEIAESGFSACEIAGTTLLSFSRQMEAWLAMIGRYPLTVSAAYETGHFMNEKKRRELFLRHESIARLLQQANIPQVILGPGMKLKRSVEQDDWHKMLGMIEEIAKRYRHYGIRIALHPHLGSPIFTRKEIDMAMERVAEDIYLVPDVGHAAEAGYDLLPLLETYFPRISCIHLKDVKFGSFGLSKTQFCELGFGDLQLAPILQFLRASKYDGYLTIEIDKPAASAKSSALQAIQYLRNNGVVLR